MEDKKTQRLNKLLENTVDGCYSHVANRGKMTIELRIEMIRI